ncbi:MAG: ABC transporter ATP-binding protein [Alphaproteobacteria bacterium]|nr:ABC transporter ATP-binding protein [Alphaproteobacteria bacterium]
MLGFSSLLRAFVDTAGHSGEPPRWENFQRLFVFLGVMLAAYAAIVAIKILGWQMGRLPYEMGMRHRLFSIVQAQSHRYFTDRQAGHVAQKVMEIPYSMTFLLAQVAYGILPALVIMIFPFIWFMDISVWMGMTAFGWAILYLALTLYLVVECTRINRKRSGAKGRVMGTFVDSFVNNPVVRTFARREFEHDYAGERIEEEKRYTLWFYRRWTIMALIQKVLLAGFFFGILYYAVALLLEGEITPGGLAMVTSILLMVSLRIEDMGERMNMSAEALGSIRDGLALLNTPFEVTDKPDAPALSVSKARLEFEGISFRYSEKQNLPALNGFSLNVQPGQKIGLVGPSGAGKTTIVSLLLRLYDLQEGSIAIDGQNIADVTQDSLRRNIAVIPQDTSLFHRTLMENIRYGRLEATDEEVIEAAKKAHAHDFIMALPEGYETLVGERGVKLSGGQRQRIAIARAILKDAPILILDEATSALDSESEKLIQESLKDLMKGKTVIAIAHRLSTISHLDRLIVMNEGRIVEDGTHAALLKQKGLYKKLWDMQSGGFIGG